MDTTKNQSDNRPIANILIEPYVFRGTEKAPETGEAWAVFIVVPERVLLSGAVFSTADDHNSGEYKTVSLSYHIELIRRPGMYWPNKKEAIFTAKNALDTMGFAFGEVL